MPNVLRRGRINGILPDVGGVVANPFEVLGDEEQIEIAAQLLGDPASARASNCRAASEFIASSGSSRSSQGPALLHIVAGIRRRCRP